MEHANGHVATGHEIRLQESASPCVLPVVFLRVVAHAPRPISSAICLPRGWPPSFRLLPIVASTFPIGSSFTFFFLSVYTRLQFLRFATANLVGIESEVVPNRGQTVFLRGFRSILPILYAKICIRYEIASRLNELLNLFFPFLFFVYMPFSIPELFRSTTIRKNYKGNVFSRTTNTSI